MSKIYGNVVGGNPAEKTYVVVDENGNEFTAVTVENVTVFDATPADVKIGKTFASENGILEGEDTKTYRTTQSYRLVLSGESFSIDLEPYDKYDYTKFQCIIAKYNTSAEDSVSTDRISLYDGVYEVNSTDKLSDITKNSDTKSVDLNITNNTDDTYIIHFFTYKEEY